MLLPLTQMHCSPAGGQSVSVIDKASLHAMCSDDGVHTQLGHLQCSAYSSRCCKAHHLAEPLKEHHNLVSVA